MPWQLPLASLLAWSPAVLSGSDPYSPGLFIAPKGGEREVNEYVRGHMEPRHAVAVGSVGKGTKRHKLLEDLAEEKELSHLLAIAVHFARGGSSLTVHRHRYPVVTYAGKLEADRCSGQWLAGLVQQSWMHFVPGANNGCGSAKKHETRKWTRSAIRAWLQDAAYPPVNRMQYQFAPAKYLTETPFGAVLVVKPITEQSDELVRALEPFAEKYRDRLKFTFFTKVSASQQLCDAHGIWSNDELLLLERPRERRNRVKHSHMPPSPKYRLEGVTPESVERFFGEYAAGTWPRYYKSSSPKSPPLVRRGVRELTGWDFAETVNDPALSVLVEFVSAGCEACEEFADAYAAVALKLQEVQRKERGMFSHLLVARMDQSANEHSELIKGTPWMRYWPRGLPKRPVDVELRSVDSIWSFLEERALEELDGEVGTGREEGVRGARSEL